MAQTVVVSDPLEVLPFHDVLDWNRYQVFCTDVLSNKLGIHDCREYLRQGNTQDGIDIYAIEKETNEKVVAQCKLEKYLSPKDVEDLTTDFLNGNFTEGVTEFILCTSYLLSKHRDETAIENTRKRLREKSIHFTLWDEQGLSRYLRNHPLPHLVYRYFGEHIAKAFYGEIWQEHIRRFKSVPKKGYKPSADYIDRTVVAYTVYQKKKTNTSPWSPEQENKEELLISLFEEPVTEIGKKVILLSVAGYGKTEELNRLASYYSSKDRITHPIRYFLRDYEGQPIETLLMNYSVDWINIPADNLLLLFDGLDEITEQYNQTFVNNLNSFLENNPLTKVLITSRFNFYDFKHEVLRNFDIYILSPISQANVRAYLSKNLGSQEIDFRNKLAKNKFSEYLDNPYYLTRLVHFYTVEHQTFLRNKGELFKKILFERLERDEVKFRAHELKEQLFPIAQKIAFCMTLAGKSILSTDELKIIVPDNSQRKDLRHFCSLNLNESAADSWAFDHKNLQEYLAASFMADFSFEKIHPYISFSFNRNRLLSRFLNTISFLFEMLSKDSPLFIHLVLWIQSSQPELFIRFEKEQLDKQTRQNIFKAILKYYKERDITIRISSNFFTEELAEFGVIDATIITYIGKELENSKSEYAYDLLQLLAETKNPFVHRSQLLSIYFSVLHSDSYSPYVYGQCAAGIVMVNKVDKSLFEQILTTNINFSDFEIRRRLINALETTTYAEQFVDFVLESISIYDVGQKEVTYALANDVLKRLLLNVETVAALKKVLQYCVIHKHMILQHSYYKGLKFGHEDTSKLLTKAAHLYKEDPSLLKLVYRIMISGDRLLYDEKAILIFKEFFSNTSGIDVIFSKMHKYGRKWGRVLHFATENSVEFLLDEYKTQKLSHDEVVSIRNNLYHINKNLAEKFLSKLNKSTGNAFIINDESIDYEKIYADYQEKNQQFLLSQSLFLQEAYEIFDKIPTTTVRYEDIQTYGNQDLTFYEYSLVRKEIEQYCLQHSNETISKAAFIGQFSDERNWAEYIVGEIAELLRNKEQLRTPLKPELLHLAEDWLITRLRETSFSGTVRDSVAGINSDLRVEFIKEVYLLLDIEIEDQLLLKMLETDFGGVGSPAELTGVSEKIVRNVKDQALLKAKVIANIRSNNLASWVLATHFKICHVLKYYECAVDIYSAIISEDLFGDYERRNLTDCYLDLGGEISDFSDFLKIPVYMREEDHLIQWEWYLLEKFKLVEKERVENILLNISSDPNQGKQGKIRAMQLLLELGRKEGIEQWATYVRDNHSLPFHHNDSPFRKYIYAAPTEETINIIIDTLDYAFENNIRAIFSFESIHDFSFGLLILIGTMSQTNYNNVRNKCENLCNKYKNKNFASRLIVFLERLDAKFHESHECKIPLLEAVSIYSKLLS